MSKSTVLCLALCMMAGHVTLAADVLVVVDDADGSVGRVAAPVSIRVDLQELLAKAVAIEQLRLVESTDADTRSADPIPVQFVADEPNSQRGMLWWLMPPGEKGQRRFRLGVAPQRAPAAITAAYDEVRQWVDVAEGETPVLRYSHGTVPVPEGVPEKYSRGDYISRLYGPNGELLTDDYPADHPHHRAVGWSWPVTRWGDEVRDIWAVVGVWARPVAMRRADSGPVVAVIEAESVWKWGDRDPIVREEVAICAFRQHAGNRFVDVEVRLTALADAVAIGGRPKAGYGGFGMRAAPVEQQKILAHADPVGASTRRAWLDYSGLFAGGKQRNGVAILESIGNPAYPSDLHQYPNINYVMPAFPGPREVPLSKETPLVLRHRLWIHAGDADEATLADVWAAYAKPPCATVLD